MRAPGPELRWAPSEEAGRAILPDDPGISQGKVCLRSRSEQKCCHRMSPANKRKPLARTHCLTSAAHCLCSLRILLPCSRRSQISLLPLTRQPLDRRQRPPACTSCKPLTRMLSATTSRPFHPASLCSGSRALRCHSTMFQCARNHPSSPGKKQEVNGESRKLHSSAPRPPLQVDCLTGGGAPT